MSLAEMTKQSLRGLLGAAAANDVIAHLDKPDVNLEAPRTPPLPPLKKKTPVKKHA